MDKTGRCVCLRSSTVHARGIALYLLQSFNCVLFLHTVCNSGKQLSTTSRRDPWEVEPQNISYGMLLPLLCTDCSLC